MVAMPEDVVGALREAGVFVFITATNDGAPNGAYISSYKVQDDENILICDEYFDKTRRNLDANGQVALLFMDGAGRAFQIKGTAEHQTTGRVFEQSVEWTRPDRPCQGIVVVKVDSVYRGAKKLA